MAVAWLSQFGPEPNRKKYPPQWQGPLIALVPPTVTAATAIVKVICNGVEHNAWSVSGENEIEVQTTVATHSFQFYTNYRGAQKLSAKQNNKIKPVIQSGHGAISSRHTKPSYSQLILATSTSQNCCC